MERFTFNLQPVLDHRLLLEEREQEKLVKIHQEIALAETRRQQLCVEIHELRYLMAQPQQGEVCLDKILQVSRFVEKLEADAAALALKIGELEKQKRIQSEALLKARHNREVLENLKEKNLTQYRREASVMEQKLLDELAAMKFAAQDEQNLPGR